MMELRITNKILDMAEDPRGFDVQPPVSEAREELAELQSERDRLREAAQQANKELRRKLKDGEVVYNVLYSAQEILTAALDKDA